MAKGRRQAESHEYLYQRFGGHRSGDGWLLCFYCGMPADTFDHHPPLSRVDDYRSLGLRYERFVKVPCCRECNTLLGDSMTNSLLGREQLVKSLLRKKYKRFLTDADWRQTELDALGKNMRSKVKTALEKRDEIEARRAFTTA